jgi:hypothetical protein
MSDVLEELSEADSLSREHVQSRVDDWSRRCTELFEAIKEWMPHDWQIAVMQNAQIDEELMRSNGVPPRKLPTLEFRDQYNRSGKIIPRGLWIIGANGRLDMYYEDRHFVIVDKADNFNLPQWKIADWKGERSFSALDRASFEKALLA